MSDQAARKPNDYKSPLKPVWCPGCGDFGVVAALYRALAQLQLPQEKVAVLSGIGCSSRLPGYMATYGFNGVHGRALPVATGLKASRPDLTVIVAGGDGDGVSIGAGHFIHTARRNADITYVMMDNQIYGLTKGQVAPTTPTGDKTKSTLYGNPDPPVDPCELAIAAGATFVARTFSADMKGQVEILTQAIQHKGFSMVDIISPCVTFRGDDQYDFWKPKLRALPEGYDPSNRADAMRFCREEGVLTTGILFRDERPGLVEHQEQIRKSAGFNPASPPKIEELARNYYP